MCIIYRDNEINVFVITRKQSLLYRDNEIIVFMITRKQSLLYKCINVFANNVYYVSR